ncbi:AAA family ATPase [Streptomyces goshikiensis]
MERDEQIAKLTSWVSGAARPHGSAHGAARGATLGSTPDAPSRPGRIAVISGPVASGKTALLHRVLERTADSGVRLLSAVPSAAEQDIPFGVVEELLRDTTDIAGPLPLLGPAGAEDLVPAQTLMAFHARLAGLAAHGPVLIAIDDVQYADPQSLHCLRYALDRARSTGARLSLMVTRGPDAGATPPHVLEELLRQSAGLRLRLRPLSARGVEALLAHRAEEAPRTATGAPDPSHTARLASSLQRPLAATRCSSTVSWTTTTPGGGARTRPAVRSTRVSGSCRTRCSAFTGRDPTACWSPRASRCWAAPPRCRCWPGWWRPRSGRWRRW